MGLAEITDDVRKEEELIALTLAASLLTPAQIKIVAQLCANNRAEQIEMAMLRTQPPIGQRGGPLLPYLVAGRLQDFPLYLNDIVLLLTTIFTVKGDLMKGAARLIANLQGAIGNARGASIGSAAFYAGDGAEEASPNALHRAAATTSIQALYAVQGLTEHALGTGMTGLTPIKGNLPDTARSGGGSTIALRTVAQDPTLSGAAVAAASLEKSE